jgi:predicted lipid-binding transport protein (Tim44 family)
MFTLVQIPRSATSSPETASLVADYVAFDKRRASRRQYQKAFGGMAIIVLLGALFGRVGAGEAAIVAALLMLPVLALAVVEVTHWRRLTRRLDRVRADIQTVRKS